MPNWHQIFGTSRLDVVGDSRATELTKLDVGQLHLRKKNGCPKETPTYNEVRTCWKYRGFWTVESCNISFPKILLLILVRLCSQHPSHRASLLMPPYATFHLCRTGSGTHRFSAGHTRTPEDHILSVEVLRSVKAWLLAGTSPSNLDATSIGEIAGQGLQADAKQNPEHSIA